MNQLHFTPEKRDQLRIAHTAAVERGASEFEWAGATFVTDYAKYLLEYLDNVFAQQSSNHEQ